MRDKEEKRDLSVQGIASTDAVLLAMDLSEQKLLVGSNLPLSTAIIISAVLTNVKS